MNHSSDNLPTVHPSTHLPSNLPPVLFPVFPLSRLLVFPSSTLPSFQSSRSVSLLPRLTTLKTHVYTLNVLRSSCRVRNAHQPLLGLGAISRSRPPACVKHSLSEPLNAHNQGNPQIKRITVRSFHPPSFGYHQCFFPSSTLPSFQSSQSVSLLPRLTTLKTHVYTLNVLRSSCRVRNAHQPLLGLGAISRS